MECAIPRACSVVPAPHRGVSGAAVAPMEKLMSPGVTFRCTCEHCGAIFFGPDRKATACIKCAKRHKIRTELPRQTADLDDDPFAAALISADPRPSRGSHRRAAAVPRGSSDAVVASRSAAPPGRTVTAHADASPMRGPRATELTEERRAQILSAYQEYEGRDETPLRRIHAEIAEKTNLARALVARVIAEVRTPPAALTEEQRESIIARYREYVRTMARPATGRRATIAREMGLSRQQVVTVVREWGASQPTVTDLSREELFRIECAYCSALEAGEPYDGLARRIASKLGFTEWQVERWIDMLHDGDFSDVDDPTDEQKEMVISAYQEYLQGDGPPPKSLHVVLGERFGLVPRQIHKTLVEYRLDRRREAFGF